MYSKNYNNYNALWANIDVFKKTSTIIYPPLWEPSFPPIVTGEKDVPLSDSDLNRRIFFYIIYSFYRGKGSRT